ncbi:MAG: FecR domain-containing protein [Candidatus Omnitrophica bacterium]|nr:FecR domain-containing protein [Candidatus Omnitrophota bacterium]
MTNGIVNAGTLEARGDLAHASTFDGGTVGLIIDGTGAQTFTGTATQTAGLLLNLTINKASGVLTLAGTIRTNGNWTYTAGTLNPGTSTVVFVPNSNTISGSHSLNNVIIDPNSAAGTTLTVASGTTLTVQDLTFDNSSTGATNINTGILAVQGNITVADSNSYTGSATLLINGTGPQTFTDNATQTSGDIPNVNINKPSGTLTLSGTFRTSRNWTYSAGTLNPGTSTVVFVPNLNTISGSHSLNNVIIDSNSAASTTLTVSSGTVLAVQGDLTIDNSSTGKMTLNTGTITVQGNVKIGAGPAAYDGSTLLVFVGSANQTFDLTGAADLLDLDVTVNKSAGQVTLASDLTMNAAGQDLDITAGTFDLNGKNLSVNGSLGTFIVRSGGILRLQGGEAVLVNSGNPQLQPGSTVIYYGTGASYTLKNFNYSNLTIDGGASTLFSFPANLTTVATLRLNNGAIFLAGFNLAAATLINNTTVRLQGNETVTLTNGNDIDSGTWEYVGRNIAETLVIQDWGATDYFNLTINDTNPNPATFTLGSPLKVAGAFALTSGIFDAGIQSADFDGNLLLSGGTFNAGSNVIAVGGNFTVSGGTFNENTSTVVFDGGSITIDVLGTETFYNLTLSPTVANANYTIADNDTLIVTGLLTLTDGNINQAVIPAAGSIDAQGGIAHAGTFDGGTGLLAITGSSSRAILLSGGGELPAVILNAPQVTVSGPASGTTTFDGSLTIQAGTFAGDTGAIDLNGSFSLSGGAFIAPSGALTVSGSWSKTGGTFDPGSNTVTFDGSGLQTLDSGNAAFYNILHSGTGTLRLVNNPLTMAGTLSNTAGTFDGSTSSINVDGDLILSSGTFTAPSTTLSVAGNWTHTGGTFIHNSGTVVFDGSVAVIDVLSSETFNNLTFAADVAGAAKTVADGDTLLVLGNLTLTEGAIDQGIVPAAGTVAARGNLFQASTFDGGTGTLVIDGSGNQTFQGNATLNAGDLPSTLVINKSGGTLTFTGTVRMEGGTWNYVSGNVDMTTNGATLALGGDLSLDTQGTGGTLVFYNLAVTGGKTVVAGDLDVDGALTITDGILDLSVNNPNVNTAGNVAISGLGQVLKGSGIWTFDGAGTSSLVGNNQDLGVAVVDGAAKTVQLGGPVTFSTLTIGLDDTLSLAGNDVTIGTLSNNGTFQLQGNETVTLAANDTNSGAWIYQGRNVQENLTIKDFGSGADYYDLVINDTNVNRATFTAGAPLTVAGGFQVNSGTFNANGNPVTVAGLVTVAGGDYQASTGLQTFNGGLTVTSGTFAGGAGDLDLNGNLTLSGGALSAPSGTFFVSGNWTHTAGGTFLNNSGTVIFDGTSTTIDVPVSETFNDLIVRSSAGGALTVANNDTLVVNGTLTLTDGAINQGIVPSTGTIAVRGNISQSPTFLGGTGGLVIDGAGNQTFTGFATPTAGSLPDVNINKASGILTLSGTIRTDQDWTYTAGTLDAGTSTLVFVPNGNTITGSHSLSNVIFDSNSPLARTITLSPGTTLTAAGTLTLDNSSTGTMTLNGGTLAAQGDVTVGAGPAAYNGTATLAFTGSGTQRFDLTGAADLLDLDVSVNKPSGQVDLASGLVMDASGQDLTIVQGVLFLNGNDLSLNGAGSIFSNNGTLRLQGAETVVLPAQDTDSGTWEYVGRGLIEVITLKDFGAVDYYNLVINDTNANQATFMIGAPLTVAGTLTVRSRIFDASGQNATLGGLTISGGRFVGSSGLVDVNGEMRMTGGELVAPAGAFTVSGDWLMTGGVFTPGSGVVNFDGAGVQRLDSGGLVFNRVEHSGVGTLQLINNGLVVGGTFTNSAGIFDASGQRVDINGTFTQTGGAVTAPSGTMAVSGDFIRTGGIFDANGGTVLLDGGSQTITGSTTFYALSKTVTAAAPLTFEAGQIQTIQGPLTLRGTSGELLLLRSSSDGIQWMINPQGIRDISYVSVMDSNNINAIPITAGFGSLDLGGNTNWSFSPIPVIPLPEVGDKGIGLPGIGGEIVVPFPVFSPEVRGGQDLSFIWDRPAFRNSLKTSAQRFRQVDESGLTFWFFFDEKYAKKLRTRVKVLKGTVTVIDRRGSMAILEAGEAAQMKYLAPELMENSEFVAGFQAPSRFEEEGRTGRISDLRGEVFVRSQGGDWRPASQGVILKAHDQIRTGKEGSAQILLDRGKVARLELREKSFFRIHTLARDPRSGDRLTLLELAVGKILVQAEELPGDSSFKIRTPTSTVVTRGGAKFEVHVEETEA